MLSRFFNRKKRESGQASSNISDIPVPTIRDAENGSEILYALARRLEANRAHPHYVEQIRRTARAMREVTNFHPEHDPSPSDCIGASEHATEIRAYPV